MNKKASRILAVLTAMMMLLAAMPAQAADAVLTSAKEETVYARIQADGTPGTIYVVNRFEVTEPGTITDTGDYEAVQNLSGTQPITLADGTVTFEAEAGNAYYQATMAASDLPWHFDIGYTLDGETVAAEALAGASGELGITLKTSRNEAIDASFYDHYMLQISITLDTALTTDIQAGGATIASAGADKLLVYTVLPGKDADISITATVHDFAMPSMEIAAMPYAMDFDLPDTDSMVEQFQTLADAIADLNDGAASLVGGVAELSAGAASLAGGSAEFATGIAQLNESATQLGDGSAQINQALADVATSLGAANPNEDTTEAVEPTLGSLTQLPEALRQMAAGLTQSPETMAALASGIPALVEALDGAIAAIPDGVITQEAIGALMQATATDKALAATASQLTDYYAAARTLKLTYTTQDEASGQSLQTTLAALGETIPALVESMGTLSAALEEMATGIETALASSDSMQQIGQLADAFAHLSAQYAQFHEGLTAYTGGVAQLAERYAGLDGGIASLADGIATLDEGAGALASGTAELNDGAKDLPATVQTEIDGLLADYAPSEFTPVSFASGEENGASSVQFVIMTDAIEVEAEAVPVPEPTAETVWDRIRKLF